jgi:hypothetical protein
VLRLGRSQKPSSTVGFPATVPSVPDNKEESGGGRVCSACACRTSSDGEGARRGSFDLPGAHR